jgi:hypothetical protein
LILGEAVTSYGGMGSVGSRLASESRALLYDLCARGPNEAGPSEVELGLEVDRCCTLERPDGMNGSAKEGSWWRGTLTPWRGKGPSGLGWMPERGLDVVVLLGSQIQWWEEAEEDDD